jgi:hypothetical protein
MKIKTLNTTLARAQMRYEVTNLRSPSATYFSDRLPRRDSKVWSRDWIVYDLRANCQVRQPAK